MIRKHWKKAVVGVAVVAAAVVGVQALTQEGAGILPNHMLTPGATNPDITQDNLQQTLCNPSWSTKSIRPPSSYTTRLKQYQLGLVDSYTMMDGDSFPQNIFSGDYKQSDTNTADYEEDHLISLELGGNPTDPANLWPESYKTTPNAHDKDKVENYLHAELCNGQITLAEAQQEISGDWTIVYKQMQGGAVQYGALVPDVGDPDDE